MATIASYDAHLDQLVKVAERLKTALDRAGVLYRIVGGLAVYLHVRDRDPLAARTTRDIDVAVRREDLDKIRAAADEVGFQFRRVAGMLVDREAPSAKSAVHFVFLNERVRPEYVEAVPSMAEAVRNEDGLLIVSVADLVRMKLTSFRLKDQVHIQDMDGVGLITEDVERGLPSELMVRLAQIRAQP